MAIRIACPWCKASFAIESSLAGTQILCRECQKPMRIPAVKTAPPAAKTNPNQTPPSGNAIKAKGLAQSPPRVAEAAGKRTNGNFPVNEAGKKGNRLLLFLLLAGGLAFVGVLIIGGVGIVAAVLLLKPGSRQPVAQGPVRDQPVVVARNQVPNVRNAGGEVHGAAGNGQLDAQVLDKIKRATVYIRVTLADGRVAEGSGFFAIEPGIVLTNAHVLDMLKPKTKSPRKVEIVCRSGERDSRTLIGKILGVDRDSDLALLRVAGKNAGAAGLPEPLEVKSTNDLIETQTVYVVGFPLGDFLGKNITVSTSSISSLRKSPTGEMEKVQVNGGMHPGNSGGPVVTTSGDVIGVAVSIIQGTQLNFAVPGDFVQMVANGRLGDVRTGESVRSGNQLKMPVYLDVFDPLSRVKKVSFDWWTASANKSRPPSDTQPLPEIGDSPHQQMNIPYRAGVAQRADIFVPTDMHPGQVLWIQPMVVNGAGKAKWLAARPFRPTTPVERIPALLALKQYWGARPVTLSSTSTIHAAKAGWQDVDLSIELDATMTETMVSRQEGAIDLRMRYLQFDIQLPKEMRSLEADAKIKRLKETITTVHADLVTDDKNNLTKTNIDVSKTPPDSRQDLMGLHKQIQESLEALSVPLPGREVQPGEKWTAKRPLMVFTGERGQAAAMEVTYTFAGVRRRNGHQEAVIKISGVARNREKQSNVTGTISGSAYLDLVVHQFASADVKAELTMVWADRSNKSAVVTMESKMERQLGQEVLNVRDRLTNREPRDAKNRPYKIHTVQLEAGRPCVISLESPKGPGWFDTYLCVKDPTGKLLAEDDDRGVDLNSLVVFTPATSGTYEILATCFEPAMGDYLLVVRQ